MIKFKNIINATTIINENFIFDPWIYGYVFYGMWRPYPKPNFKKNLLNNIKYCFISHVHQDHWDIETIKYFNKNTKFIIPDMPFNKIIGHSLNKLGFSNITYCQMGKWLDLNSQIEISIVPPLNDGGFEQNHEIKPRKDNNSISIDTGLMIKCKKDKSYHLLLGDNVPYNLKLFKKIYKKINVSTVFFPHNGYATDFPLNYTNFNLNKKIKLSLEKSKKTEKSLVKFFKYIKPKMLVPFSAQFSINNKKKQKLFNTVNNKEFFHKDLYSSRINKITKINSAILYQEDELTFESGCYINKIRSNYKTRRKESPIKKVNLPKIKNTNEIEKLLNTSFDLYFKRLSKFKIKINFNKIKLVISLKKINYILDFESKKIIKSKNIPRNNYLNLITDAQILVAILTKKLHIDNCVVAFLLFWKRNPNKYNKNLYNSLSFLHI